MNTMKRKFHRPDVKEHKVLSFEDNMVHVEFPHLTGKSKEDLELVTSDFILTITIKTVGGAFIDGRPVDLFDREAGKQARQRAKKRER